MTYYYCTCLKDAKRRDNRADSARFRLVEVDIEGICKECGYYAISSPRKVDAYNGDLYRLIFRESPPIKPERVKDGLSIKVAKDCARAKKERQDAKQRKDKNGNMDV
jgi:hypothetical protein